MRSRLAVGAVLVGVLAGCGIPSQTEPSVIERTSVPFSLLDPGHRQHETGDADTSETAATVYFVKNKTLVGVQRGIRTGPMTSQAAAVLTAMAVGPDQDEQSRGLSTAVPPSLHLNVTQFRHRQITIEIASEPSGVTAAESPLTVAQIVLSLTSLPGVDKVQLTRDHQPIEAPLADGSLTSAPLTVKDYNVLRESDRRSSQ